MRLIFPALLLCSATPLYAEPGLPPEPLVQAALDGHPLVEAAKARVAVAQAEEHALKAGSHEFAVAGSYVRRSVSLERSYDEFDATLSRAIRLPGKARLDSRAGAFGVKAAENHWEDAKHQAALLLAELWWNWLGASSESQIDAQAVTNLEAALKSVRRRVALRDAALLEADQAEAALGAARLAAAQSQGRASLARSRLQSQFPLLALPDAAEELPLPEIPATGFALMRDQVVERSHEIAAAEAEAARASTLAQRAEKDRIADPTLGLRLFSERNGAERGAGLVVSMPIGGGYRKAQTERTSAEAAALLAQLGAVRFDVQEIAGSDLAQAESGWAVWRRSRDSVAAQVAAVLKLRKGYDLGAIDLSDLLLAERQTQDAFRAESIARAEALRAITNLRIDSHNLWISE